MSDPVLIGAAKAYMVPEKEAKGVNIKMGLWTKFRLMGFFAVDSRKQRRSVPILNVLYHGSGTEEQTDWGWSVFVSEAAVLDHGHFHWFTNSGFVFFARQDPTRNELTEIDGRTLKFAGHYPGLFRGSSRA